MRSYWCVHYCYVDVGLLEMQPKSGNGAARRVIAKTQRFMQML